MLETHIFILQIKTCKTQNKQEKKLPILNIYLDKGRSWKRDKVTYEMARTKDDKIALSPPVFEEWKKLIILLAKNLDYFYKSI